MNITKAVYHVTHIRTHNGITKVDMIRGNIKFGTACWIMFKDGVVIDCTFKLDTIQAKNMEKEARKVMDSIKG